uniref:Uncharacterized protein n=1 Tax=Panagrolaimus sp. ES5 TaxID=591445 RepID=A0AC34FVF2_9BILA
MYGDNWREGPTPIPIGCYDFVGLVRCKNGSAILSSATIELWEDDLFWDDHLHTQKLRILSNGKTAGFSFQKCDDDGRILLIGPKFDNIELYYFFKNVCFEGDKYVAETVEVETHNKTNVYILDGEYAYLFFE